MFDWFWYSLAIIVTAGYVYWIARFFMENSVIWKEEFFEALDDYFDRHGGFPL